MGDEFYLTTTLLYLVLVVVSVGSQAVSYLSVRAINSTGWLLYSNSTPPATVVRAIPLVGPHQSLISPETWCVCVLFERALFLQDTVTVLLIGSRAPLSIEVALHCGTTVSPACLLIRHLGLRSSRRFQHDERYSREREHRNQLRSKQTQYGRVKSLLHTASGSYRSEIARGSHAGKAAAGS